MIKNVVAGIVLLVVLIACQKLEPSDANDLSRLALLDLATAVELVNDDRTCGFESAAAIATQQVIGDAGGEGTVVRTIEGCAVDLDATPERYPYFVCDANAGRAHGKVIFSGTRTLTGRITGDDANPVIPSSSEALTITVREASFEDFEVSRKDKAGSLSILSGRVSGTVHIGLVASASDGLCRVATPNARLEDIRFEDAIFRFTNLLKVRDYGISSSLLSATNGQIRGAENQLSGTMMVDGMTMDIPYGDEPPLFDPEYDAAAFQASFACSEGQAKLPVTQACADIGEMIAENTSRISFLAFVDLVALVENDKRCGFSSPLVQSTAVTEGELGQLGALIHHVRDCTITLPYDTSLEADCLGNSDVVSGQATISATKILRGTLTDDPEFRILPLDDAPLSFEITAGTLENFSATRGERSALIRSGSLTGRMLPRVAKGLNRGFCSVGTPIAEFTDVNLANAEVRLKTDVGIVTGSTEQSALWGINGAWKGKENALGGTIAVNGQTFALPAMSEWSGAFEPNYDPATFAASWQCDQALSKPISFDCSAELPVPETIARMSVGMVGALTAYIENNATCGFASPAVREAAQFSTPVGDIGTATFNVEGCRLSFPQPTVISQDCNNKTITVQGDVVVNATKRMTGYNTGSLAQQVIPTLRDGTAFVSTIDLSNFTYVENNPFSSEQQIGLKITQATIGGAVSPRLALDRSTGACSKATPTSTFEGVNFKAPTEVLLLFPGLDFTTRVSNMSLSAQSGSKDGVVNSLRGGLTIGTDRYDFPSDGSMPLDIAYDPARFAASYQCDANLVVVRSDTECDFKEILALQTARYLPMVVQSVGNTVNADGDCGLNIAEEQLEPYRVNGNEGTIGDASWRGPHNGQGACTYALNQTYYAAQDCRGRRLYLQGNLAVSADLKVRGRVEEYNDNIYINPTSPDGPTDYQLTIPAFLGLRVALVDPPTTIVQWLSIDGGAFDILFHPIMGYNSSDDDPDFTFLVRTPINRFERINFSANTPANITLTVNDMKFNAKMSSAAVSGFAGVYNGEANRIAGTVTLDGRAITVDDLLDPEYNQTDFDDRYRCTPDLFAVIPTQYP